MCNFRCSCPNFTRKMASLEKIMDSSFCVPISGSPATSSMDMSNKNNLSSSTITGTNSVKNSNDMSDTTIVTVKLSDCNNNNKIIDNLKSEKAEYGSMSGRSSVNRSSCSSGLSDSNESICNSFSSAINESQKANDSRWEVIQLVKSRDMVMGLSHFRLLKCLGCGDIASMYLAELRRTKCYFAMKVIDKESLASGKKLLRAQIVTEIPASCQLCIPILKLTSFVAWLWIFVAEAIFILSDRGNQTSIFLNLLQESACKRGQLNQNDLSFVFRLKVADNATLYGCCMVFKEVVQKPPGLMAMIANASVFHVPLSQFFVSAPHCYCILSKMPFFNLHFAVLKSIFSQERLERIIESIRELSFTSEANNKEEIHESNDGFGQEDHIGELIVPEGKVVTQEQFSKCE